MNRDQLEFKYEAFATEEQVVRMAEAFNLACDACFQTDVMEYRTNPDKGTTHTAAGWRDHFMQVAFARIEKRKDDECG